MKFRTVRAAALFFGIVAATAFAKGPIRYSGVRSKIRVSAVTEKQCEDTMHSGKCRGAVLDFVLPKCKAIHPTGFSTGVNLLLAVDGQAIKDPQVFYSAIKEDGPHSIKLYWYEKDPESAAFLSGIRNISFDLAQCR